MRNMTQAMEKRRLSKKTKIVKDAESLPTASESTTSLPTASESTTSLPPDLMIEILKRFPLKLIATFLLVSKLWAQIIRSKDFIRSFPFPYPKREQMPFLFVFNTIHMYTGHYKWFFFLYSSGFQQEPQQRALSPLALTKGHSPYRRLSPSDVHYVNGLLSLGYGQQQIINNPSTGKSICLPKVKSRKKIIQSYFGFDPVECEYKVLCMGERLNDYSNVPSSDHQVFTVGGGIEKQSWRMIECDTPHCPKTNGVCIDGVLYYGAVTGSDMMEWCIMRFDVRTEKLDLVSRLNEDVVSISPDHSPSLINYHGKVALASQTSRNRFDLWVMEDGEKWCKVSFSLGRVSGDSAFRITGTTHTGEIVLVSRERLREQDNAPLTCVILYNHREYKVNRVIWLNLHDQFKLGADQGLELLAEISLLLPFSDYVESAMLL